MFIPFKFCTPTGVFFANAVLTQATVFDEVFGPVLEVACPAKDIIKGTIPVEDIYAVSVLGKFKLEVSMTDSLLYMLYMMPHLLHMIS